MAAAKCQSCWERDRFGRAVELVMTPVKMWGYGPVKSRNDGFHRMFG